VTGPGLVLAALELRERSGGSCEANNGFCPDWIANNLDRYLTPFWQHVYLSVIAVAAGFAIAFALAMVAHRRRWLVGPVVGVTGVLYTLPSIAVFFLLQPITGRGALTALIALTAYTLLIIFRNIMTGLDNVPAEAKDAGRGMGLTDNQLLRRVELPLALPLAFFAGAGGLGGEIFADITFKSNVVVAGVLCILLAVFFDLVLLGAQRVLVPWRRATR